MDRGPTVVPGAIALPGRLGIAVTLALTGVLCIAGVWHFRRAGTTVDPRPPEHSVTLVTSGIYAMSSNPMYLGFVLLLGAWVVALAHLAGVVVLMGFALYLDRVQIRAEEVALRRRFHTAFDDYAARVSRWL